MTHGLREDAMSLVKRDRLKNKPSRNSFKNSLIGKSSYPITKEPQGLKLMGFMALFIHHTRHGQS